jgi:hypothetical protein
MTQSRMDIGEELHQLVFGSLHWSDIADPVGVQTLFSSKKESEMPRKHNHILKFSAKCQRHMVIYCYQN